MQNLVSQPYLFIINVSSVIIHSIINTSFIYIKDFDTVSIGGHLHFTGTELKSSYLMMGVTSGHSDGHVTLV